MKTIQIVTAWVFIGFSLLHSVTAFLNFHELTEKALWFFSAGITLCFAGIINIMSPAAGQDTTIKKLTLIANCIITLFVLVFGYHSLHKNLLNPMAWILVCNAITAFVISIQQLNQQQAT